MTTKKKKEPGAAGAPAADPAEQIKRLEERIETLNNQLQEATSKKRVDPDLVEKLTDRIAALEEKLEDTQKMSRIELPEEPPEPGPRPAKQPKKKEAAPDNDEGCGIGMF